MLKLLTRWLGPFNLFLEEMSVQRGTLVSVKVTDVVHREHALIHTKRRVINIQYITQSKEMKLTSEGSSS